VILRLTGEIGKIGAKNPPGSADTHGRNFATMNSMKQGSIRNTEQGGSLA
jgi:hypothetical protein